MQAFICHDILWMQIFSSVLKLEERINIFGLGFFNRYFSELVYENIDKIFFFFDTSTYETLLFPNSFVLFSQLSWYFYGTSRK